MNNLVKSSGVIFEERMVWQGKEYLCQYIDKQDFSNISPITQVQALCFLPSGEFVIYQDKEGNYGLPGGTVEKGESLEETLERELREEAAIKPIKYGPLLYLRITNPPGITPRITYQARYWALVELLDEEVNDPDDKAIKRLIVDEKKLLEYVDWGRKLKIYLDKFNEIRKYCGGDFSLTGG